MKEERAAYIQAIRDLDGDLPGRRAALDFVEQSDIWVHGAPARFPYVPYRTPARRFTPSSPRLSRAMWTTLPIATCSASPRK